MFGASNALYFQSWELEAPAEAKRVVVLLHDLGDHSGGWQNVVDYLYRRVRLHPLVVVEKITSSSSSLSQRYTIYAADLAHHGRSAGVRGHIDSIAALADDANTLVRPLSFLVRRLTRPLPLKSRLVRRRENVKSVAFVGHGLGALVALEVSSSVVVCSIALA